MKKIAYCGELPKRDWPNLRKVFAQGWRRITEVKEPEVFAETRECNECGLSKKWSDFHRKHTGVNGHTSKCKECILSAKRALYKNDPVKANAPSKRWRENKPEDAKKAGKRGSLKHHYGITLDEYAFLLEKQKGLCGICSEPMDSPNVDHNHTTGKIRELLCPTCNRGLGFFKESISKLELAIMYLRRHE